MINKNVEKAINQQINAEFWSAYLYLSMSAYFKRNNLPGFANWMQIQFQEESAHALKLFNYLNDRGGKVTLTSIAQVEIDWKDVIHVFEETLKHEQKVTSMINEIMDIAINEKDHASISFLKWFVDEQVEEEASVEEILGQLNLFEGKGHGLFLMDREMNTRVFVDPNQAV